MATFYIDPSAATNGNGSLASPFNTWAAAWSAASNNSSDVLLQREGTVWNGVVACSRNGASAAKPIVVGVYDSVTGQRITGRRGAAVVDAQGAGIAFNLWDRYNLLIEGFEIRNAASYGVYEGHSSGTAAQKAAYLTSIQLRSLHIHNIYAPALAAIWMQGSGVTFSNLLIEDCGGDGFSHSGQLVCEDTTIRRINNTGGGQGDCGQMQTVLSGTILRRCVFDHTNNNQKQCIVIGVSTTPVAATVLVEDCVFYGDVEGAGLASVDFVDGVTFRRNKFFGSKGIYVLGASSVVDAYSNLIIGRGDNSIGIGSAVGSIVRARHNTIVNHQRGLELLGINGVAQNNLVHCPGAATPISATNKAGNWTHLDGDPLLNAHYRPLPGSPLIGAGQFNWWFKDADNKFFNTPPSIGAYEFKPKRKLV